MGQGEHKQGPTRLGYVTPQSVSEALRLLVHRAGITIESLAEQAGISRTSVSAHLGGERRMSLDVLGKLVAVLAGLLGYDENLLGSELLEVASREQATGALVEQAPSWVSEELVNTIRMLALDASWNDDDLLHLTLSREQLLHGDRPYLRELEVLSAHFDVLMDVETTPDGLIFTLRPGPRNPVAPSEERT